MFKFIHCETEYEAFREWWSILEASRSIDELDRGSRRDMAFSKLREQLTYSLKACAITSPTLCLLVYYRSSAHRCCAFLSAP